MQTSGSTADGGGGAAMTFRATAEQLAQFVRGMQAVLQQWTALQLVAQHCDRHAVTQLQHDLAAWHARDGEVFADEMEDFFDDYFSNVRSVSIEDDSAHEVATVLHDMYRRCCHDDFAPVERWQQTAALYAQHNPLAQCVNAGGVDSDVDSDEDSDDDDDDANDNEEEQPQHTAQRQHRNNNNNNNASRRKKNAVTRSADGWSMVV